jgi:hypothetical protein
MDIILIGPYISFDRKYGFMFNPTTINNEKAHRLS